MAAPLKRSVLRYHGGKWRLAPWIITHMPAHRVYVEPFGGAASVLLRKSRSYAEVYNDLDGGLIELFRVLRCPDQAAELCRLLALTPYARAEFDTAYERSEDPVERARRLVIRGHMGFGSWGVRLNKTGFRSSCTRSGTTPAHDWARLPSALSAVTERLKGVVIECRPAIDVMRQHDGPDTLHYCDPPYLHETRGRTYGRDGYRHEMTDSDHAELLDAIKGLSGMVLLSGYRSQLYDRALLGWARIDRLAMADGASPRIESLWLNQDAAKRMQQPRML